MRTPAWWSGLLAVTLAPLSGAAQDADLEGVGFTLGSPDAPVVVVEYADFACSACAQFARTTWPTIRRDYVETGRVFWRIVPFELGFPNSDDGARAGQCGADQGAFWPMHDVLYERQADWNDERRPRDALVSLAASIGLDGERFRECLEGDPHEDRRDDANRAARRDRVRATPTFFVSGFRVQGALPPAAFVQLLESAGS